MTHKKKIKYWKEKDPIHYYEMTSDPTGVGYSSAGGSYLVVIAILAIGILIGLNY